MLRTIIVLSLLGAFDFETCRGATQTDDWRTQGYYRPRRNYPDQSQNGKSFQASHGQNYQSQNTFRSEFNQSSTGSSRQNERNPFGINYHNSQKQSSFASSYSQPQLSFGSGSQNTKASDTSRTNFGQNNKQNVFGTSNPQREPFGFNSQKSFKTGYSQSTVSENALGSANQNSFAASFSQHAQGTNNGQNSFRSSFSHALKTSSQPLFGSYSQNTKNSFERNFNNHKNQNSFSNLGQNIQTQNSFESFQSQNPFSSFGSNSAFAKGRNYQGPEYLPPKRFMAPEYLPPKDPSTTSKTTRRPFYTTTRTRRAFYTTTTTRRPFYSTTVTRRPFYTTTTTKRPIFTTTTTKRPISTTATIRPTQTNHPIPTIFMPAPPPDDDGNHEILPDKIKTPTIAVSPAMAMLVPPEPDPEPDDGEIFPDFTTTTKRPVAVPAPAMAMPVPPEEDDPTTPSITTSTTTTITPSTTNSTTPSTTTSITTTITTTTPSTTTSTTPSTTTSTTPSTTTSTTTTTTTPPTTTSTSPSTTTSTTPSTTNSTTPSTTTSTTPSTTTSTTTTKTTPPTTNSAPPSTTTSTTPSTTTSITSTTTTHDRYRNLIEEESSPTTPPPETTPSTTTFKAPDYLPPDNTTRKPVQVPPSPALAMPVPPEPECNSLDPNTYPSEVDQRYFADSPCAPTKSTTVKPPYRGPLYLPPPPEEPLCVPKTRVRRSTDDTLRLAELTGTPRPVWYAGIYKKVTDPYYPICGGSIVREDIVISAAHCFWADVGGKQAAELFAVAASKIYKPWKDPMDKKAQKSDVSDITIPPRYLGAKASFQEDIAILKLAKPFKYTRGVRPICVDFDVGFDRQQLKSGHSGTFAGWGYIDSKGTPTQRLLWLELPYIDIEKCIRESEASFLKYITSDKVCAGENDTGKALCRGDSGGGLAFWQGPASHATPYLRGVASTAPTDKNAACNVYAYGSFTWLYAHRTFLRDHVPDIERCRFWE